MTSCDAIDCDGSFGVGTTLLNILLRNARGKEWIEWNIHFFYLFGYILDGETTNEWSLVEWV